MNLIPASIVIIVQVFTRIIPTKLKKLLQVTIFKSSYIKFPQDLNKNKKNTYSDPLLFFDSNFSDSVLRGIKKKAIEK